MSRVAKTPVVIPENIDFSFEEQCKIIVKGPKGQLQLNLHPSVAIERSENNLSFKPTDGSKFAKALSGTMRSLVNNLIQGVVKGFEKKLELRGVGYKAAVQANKLILNLGYSHPIEHSIPEGVTIVTPSATEVVISGCNKQQVGQEAAKIRAYRKPEPYKGKGIRYHNEIIRMKETKK